MNEVVSVYDASRYRVPTAELNKYFENFFNGHQPPSKKGKRFKCLYATQYQDTPPKFVLKVNDEDLMSPDYERFLIKKFRDYFPNSLGVGMDFQYRSRKHV